MLEKLGNEIDWLAIDPDELVTFYEQSPYETPDCVLWHGLMGFVSRTSEAVLRQSQEFQAWQNRSRLAAE